MKPSELFRSKNPTKDGFYNIMPIDNIPSVLKHGILSYELAKHVIHESVAMEDIQDRRNRVRIPNGLELHQYANLYFDARNHMLYKRKNEHVAVLKIHCSVLDLSYVIISDSNASSNYARFYDPVEAMDKLNFEMIYARNWCSDNKFEYYKRKSCKCAEILVPKKIDPNYIVAIALKNENDKSSVLGMNFPNKIYVKQDLFFM